jgi:hypothetical protein
MQIQLIYTNGILYVNSIPSYYPRLADDALRHCLDSSDSLLLFFLVRCTAYLRTMKQLIKTDSCNLTASPLQWAPYSGSWNMRSQECSAPSQDLIALQQTTSISTWAPCIPHLTPRVRGSSALYSLRVFSSLLGIRSVGCPPGCLPGSDWSILILYTSNQHTHVRQLDLEPSTGHNPSTKLPDMANREDDVG